MFPFRPLKECAYTPTLTHMSACVYMHCVPFFCCAMLIQTGVIKTALHVWICEHFPALLGLTGRYCLQLPTKRIILPIQRTCLHAIGQLNQTTAWHNYAVYQIELACLHPANHVAFYSCKGECDSWLAHCLFVMNLVQIERGKRWLRFKVCQTLLSLQDCSTFEVQFNELFVKWLVNKCLKLPLDLPFLIYNMPHPNSLRQ